MKVKEIDRTANIAWSPAAHHPIYLAAGTAAQQLDATFSTTAALEIYALNLTEPGLDMCMKGSVVSDFRFHKIVWGCEGMKTSDLSSGVIVGGADGGNIMIYDAAKLIQGDSALIHHNTKHTGPVHSLDFNKFQDCLLASGASESEVFIWDLNNPTSPVTLGAKSQPPEDVTCVAWNCQVQHILASTFPARCVVWDLRKNEPIIKVSDSSSRLRCKVVAWHPEVATQLCLASEDDHSPVIQLWDLRFATSPLKTLEHHQRGILSIAWCQQDPDLLLSCGKDNQILCWNPNSSAENGEVLCELPTGNQWSFDVAWCTRNPAVIANSSCDGHVGVYSLMGGQQQVNCSSKIAESFPGSEKLTEPPNMESIHRHIPIPLQKPPKWVRKPVGASFGFGGKLVSFVNEAPSTTQSQELPTPRVVHISQVVTEPEILKKSEKLESCLANGNLIEFCQNKVEGSTNDQEKLTWNFLQATFNATPRAQMLSLLGYSYDRVLAEINSVLKSSGSAVSLDNLEINDQLSNLSTSENSIPGDGSVAFDNIAMKIKDEEESFIETDPKDTDGLISQALLTGNIASAVEICIQNSRWADALVLAQAGGAQILQKTQRLYFKSVSTNASKLISAVVTSDWLTMVKNCNISCWKEILAAILTYAKPQDFPVLCEILGSRLEKEPNLQQNASLCYISAGNLERLAQSWVKINENLDVTSLQSLIEQVMILRKAVEQLSGAAPPLETGVLSSLLGQYAELLATQGNLNSASTYLVDPNEKTLAILRDRIYQALGHRTPHFPFQRVEVRRSSSISQSHVHDVQQKYSQQPVSNQMHSQRHSLTHTQQNQFPYANANVSQSVVSNYPYQTSNVMTHAQYQPPQTSMASVAPPPPGVMPGILSPTSSVSSPPPEPPQTSEKVRQNSGGQHHLSQRYPRHLRDPSVYSENTYSSQQYFQPQAFTTSQPQMNSFQTQPAANFYSPPQPEPSNTGSFAYPPNSGAPLYQPQQQYNSYTPVTQPQAPISNPGAQIPPTSDPRPPLPSCYGEVKPGWNDPPPLVKKPTAKITTNCEPAAPLTTPFPNAPVPEPHLPPQGLNQPNVPPGGYFVPSYPPQAPSTLMSPAPLIPSPMPEEPKPLPTSVPEQPREKGPIPPEHQVLQDIFEDLRRQCQQVATNPQTRRKLDDVAKKLENLYDKLRDNSLSVNVTQGLHQIVQAVMQNDYPSALGIHGQIVANSNFSEISGFIPSLKVLLQTSYQLNVFLQ